jgi:hypothetical protein
MLDYRNLTYRQFTQAFNLAAKELDHSVINRDSVPGSKDEFCEWVRNSISV